MKILIMGLPGSGKTYLAERLQPLLNAAWYNADVVRKMAKMTILSIGIRYAQISKQDFSRMATREV